MPDLLPALRDFVAFWPLAYLFLGTTAGILVGAIPGLTGAMLITLTLPLTFYMSPPNAMILLVSMYVGAISGGLITAILFRIPGTPASVMTTFDGYPMAISGRPGRALGLAIGSSLCGGLIAGVFLVFLSQPLAELAARFGPFEYASLVLMALVLIATISKGSLVAGLLSGLFGMMVAMPGFDPSSGQLRVTFGFEDLASGFNLLAVLIGVFAVNQVFDEVLSIGRTWEVIDIAKQRVWMAWSDYRRQAGNILRSSLIGTWIGILPGIGASVGSIVAYSAAKNVSKTPERFGTGVDEGIVASEAANNATVGGALIPLLAMGIPGSVVDAILLGAFVIHGMRPGPLLFDQHPQIVYTVINAYLLACVAMFVIMTVATPRIARLMGVPRYLLLPVVVVFCVLGALAINNRMFDVWVVLAFGAVGFLMERAGVPLGPFVIGLVLAPIAEESLRSGLMASAGSYLPFVTRPLSLAFVLVAVGLLLWPFWQDLRTRRRRPVNAPDP